MAPGSSGFSCSVVDVKMFEAANIGQKVFHIRFITTYAVSHIPGQSKARKLKKIVDGTFFKIPESISVFYTDQNSAVTDFFSAEIPETGNGFHILIIFSFIDIVFFIRKGDIYTMIHMHVDDRTGNFSGKRNCFFNSFEPRTPYIFIDFGNIKIFRKMDCKIYAILFFQ